MTTESGPAEATEDARLGAGPARLLGAAGARLGGGAGTVFLVLVVVLALTIGLNPGFAAPTPLLSFATKAAPLVILAIGQYFVIVSGEFDLSVGSLVGAQVVIAAKLIDGEESRTVPVLLLMVAFGLAVGLVNGLITTLLKVPSFITTLGMMMVLFGVVRLWTGGAPTGALSEGFRAAGRGGIQGLPGVRQIPWAVLILIAVAVLAVLLMRRPFGRRLIATGDNDRAAAFSGVRVAQTRTTAFVLSSLLATLAGVLVGGYAGVSAQVGQGMEFTAITAVVLGGVVLGGGHGTVLAAAGGGLVLEAMFTLFNQLGWPSTARPAMQGVIIIAAVAYAARGAARRRRTPPSRSPVTDQVPEPVP